MLSPKAMNLVALSVPTRVTVTFKLQEAVCCLASRAVHTTLFEPTGKFDPLGGVQLTVSGAEPPVAVGLPKSTATGLPLSDSTLFAAGQLICS